MIDQDTNLTECQFCGDRVKDRIIKECGSVIAIRDKYPISEYHTLVLPRRHTPDFFTMTPRERNDAEKLILLLKEEIMKNDDSVIGFNIGSNCGEAAGQTILHAHLHLIPRRQGDTPNPRGGVRGVIPDKMGY